MANAENRPDISPSHQEVWEQHSLKDGTSVSFPVAQRIPLASTISPELALAAAQDRVTAYGGWLDVPNVEPASTNPAIELKIRENFARRMLDSSFDFAKNPRLRPLTVPVLALGIAACTNPITGEPIPPGVGIPTVAPTTTETPTPRPTPVGNVGTEVPTSPPTATTKPTSIPTQSPFPTAEATATPVPTQETTEPELSTQDKINKYLEGNPTPEGRGYINHPVNEAVLSLIDELPVPFPEAYVGLHSLVIAKEVVDNRYIYYLGQEVYVDDLHQDTKRYVLAVQGGSIDDQPVMGLGLNHNRNLGNKQDTISGPYAPSRLNSEIEEGEYGVFYIYPIVRNPEEYPGKERFIQDRNASVESSITLLTTLENIQYNGGSYTDIDDLSDRLVLNSSIESFDPLRTPAIFGVDLLKK